MNKHKERNKHLNRAVYNDWMLYTFVQMLKYKCALYGQELVVLDERNTSKMCSGCGKLQAMPLWKWTYRYPHEDCRLVMRIATKISAVNILKRYFARRGPHASMQTWGVLQDNPNSVEVTGASCPIVMQQLNMCVHI